MKRNNIFKAAVLAIILMGMLAGCTPQTATPTTVVEQPVATEAPVETIAPMLTITDTLGHTVSFDKIPERVVVAGKATALLVNTLYLFPEAATRIVAIENRSQTPDAFIPLVDPTYTDKLVLEKNAGPEAIAPSKPDVVILKSSMKEKLGDPLEAIGIKVIYLDLETPDTFYQDLQTIGALFGNSQRADEITAFYQDRVSQVTRRTQRPETRRKADLIGTSTQCRRKCHLLRSPARDLASDHPGGNSRRHAGLESRERW